MPGWSVCSAESCIGYVEGRTLREHLEILEAAKASDASAAEAAVSNHFQAALQRILGMF